MIRHTALISLCLLLAACGGHIDEIGREPRLSPMGRALPPDAMGGAPPAYDRVSVGSLWSDQRGAFFRDPRAARVGDILTIAISIDDKAKLDGTFDRSRASTWGAAIDFLLNASGKKTDGSADANWKSSSTTKSQGSVNRAETIKLSLAAVVSAVMPNGNLVIVGTQEMRVNYELRVLQVTGIVHPWNISRDNVVPYDKIAEARISYGGRGRVMDVQQPAYGQQWLDRFFPF